MVRDQGDIKQNKVLLFSLVLSLSVLVFAVVNLYFQFELQSGFGVEYGVFALFITALFVVAARMMCTKNIINIMIVSTLIISVCYMFLFPPITVPDEQAHYVSAYRLSNYFLFKFSANQDDAILMRQCDLDFFKNLSTRVSGEYIASIYKNATFFADNIESVRYECSYVKSVPCGYIASAIGFAVARILKLGPLTMLLVGRTANLSAFAAMLIFSVKKIPFGKMVLPVIAALPIVLHLVASLSYDGTIIGFAFMFVAQVLYIREKDNMATAKDIIVLMVLAVLLAPSKLVYLPLVFIVFIIPNKKINSTASRAIVLKFTIILIAIVTLLLFQLKTFETTASTTTSGWSDDPPYTLWWILNNPLKAIRILCVTLVAHRHFYFESMFGGLLGWFDVEVPAWYWKPHVLAVVISFLPRKNESEFLKPIESVWVWTCVAASAVLIFLSMFIAWTPMGSTVIHGVQGRYFLPLLAPLVFTLRHKKMALPHSFDRYFALSYMAINVITVLKMFLIVTA